MPTHWSYVFLALTHRDKNTIFCLVDVVDLSCCQASWILTGKNVGEGSREGSVRTCWISSPAALLMCGYLGMVIHFVPHQRNFGADIAEICCTCLSGPAAVPMVSPTKYLSFPVLRCHSSSKCPWFYFVVSPATLVSLSVLRCHSSFQIV